MLALATRSSDELSLFRANSAAGMVATWRGRLLSARTYYERALAINEDVVISGGNENELANPISRLIWLLWMLGYPDQARRQETRLLSLARHSLDSFHRTALHQSVLATRCHFLRDYRGMRQEAETLIALARENGLPYWLGCGLVRFGRIVVEEGDFTAGIDGILDGMRTFRSVGENLTYDYFCCVLAEAYLLAGRAAEGIAVLEEAITRSMAHNQRFCEPEMHRLMGELMLLSGAMSEAEKSLHDAIAIAQNREAKFWELRATMSLARLLAQQGRRDEARAVLAEIYNWFTGLRHSRSERRQGAARPTRSLRT